LAAWRARERYGHLSKSFQESSVFSIELPYLQQIGYQLLQKLINGQLAEFVEKTP
jgi:hypothetical protein